MHFFRPGDPCPLDQGVLADLGIKAIRYKIEPDRSISTSSGVSII
jgi:hypothetical protein